MSWSTGRTPPIRTRLASLTLQCSWRPRAARGRPGPHGGGRGRRRRRTGGPPRRFRSGRGARPGWAAGGIGSRWRGPTRCLSTRPRHTAHRSVAAGVRGIRPRPQGHREALTALGNGYLGTRGAAPEHAATSRNHRYQKRQAVNTNLSQVGSHGTHSVMSRDTVDRCFGTSLHFWGLSRWRDSALASEESPRAVAGGDGAEDLVVSDVGAHKIWIDRFSFARPRPARRAQWCLALVRARQGDQASAESDEPNDGQGSYCQKEGHSNDAESGCPDDGRDNQCAPKQGEGARRGTIGVGERRSTTAIARNPNGNRIKRSSTPRDREYHIANLSRSPAAAASPWTVASMMARPTTMIPMTANTDYPTSPGSEAVR